MQRHGQAQANTLERTARHRAFRSMCAALALAMACVPFAATRAFAQETSVATPAETASPPPVATEAPTGKRDMKWVYITGGGAVVFLGLGTIFGLKALSNQKEFDDAPTSELRDTGNRNALVTDVCLGIGLTLALSSAVLYFTGPAKPSSARITTPDRMFVPILGAPTSTGAPSMAGAAAIFRF